MKSRRDLVGLHFGDWLVLAYEGTPIHHSVWKCRCICGAEKSIRQDALTRGKALKCFACARILHGHSKPPSRTYKSWDTMISRCRDKKNPGWTNYGGRGIRVCERWLKFENFLADMGERPIGKTIDRYPNNDGNYEPTNCRWATLKEQGRNKRTTKLNEEKVLEIRAAHGILTIANLAKKYGVSSTQISNVQLFKTWA